jgi:hypothetical protein
LSCASVPSTSPCAGWSSTLSTRVLGTGEVELGLAGPD